MATPRKSQTLARGTRRLADASLPDLTKPQLLTYADASAVLGLGIPTLERMVANSTFRTVPGAMENVVPVERIELPTFGLQNRCSTAELNRRIEGDGVVEKKPDSAPLSRARIPDLPAKGQNLPPGPSAGGLSQAAFSVHLVLTSYWQICRRLSSPLNQMPGARSMNELSRYSYARLQPGARTQHSSSGISSVRYNLVTLPKSPFLKPRFSKAETSAFSEVSSRRPAQGYM